MTAAETLLLPDLSLEPLAIQAQYRGGFGTVYIVKDNNHNEYALKTLSSGISEDKSELYREALTAAQIKPHINVLAPSGVTTYQGTTFIIMPAKAHNLRNIMKGGSLTTDQIGQVISQISLGLAHLHENCGILHLDLKPENILYDEQGQYMISDFGLSTALPAPSTLQQNQELASEVPAGTFAYMSPEHFVSGELSAKSDIFSLGIII